MVKNKAAIAAFTVKGDPGIRPEAHIYVGSKAEWYEITDQLAQFEQRSEDDSS